MGQLPRAAVHYALALGHAQDCLHLGGQKGMPGGRRVLVGQRAHRAHPGPPAVNPFIGDFPQRAHPSTHEPFGQPPRRRLEHQLIELRRGPAPGAARLAQATFPRDSRLDCLGLDGLGQVGDLEAGGLQL